MLMTGTLTGHLSLRGVLLDETPQASPEKIEEQKPEIKYQDAVDVILSQPEKLNDVFASQFLDLAAQYFRE